MRDEYQIMLASIGLVALWIAFVIFTNRKVHPKALFFLFMVELWERFSYYGMRAFFILYLTRTLLTGGFGFERKTALGIYAAYGAMVYLTPLVGGYLADKFLGFRRAIVWGAILMAAGQFTLSASPGTEFVSYRQYEERVGAAKEAAKAAGQPEAEAVAAEEAAIAAGRTAARGSDLFLFTGLSLLVIGNGFFKPNISSMIGRFYGPGDPRRDGAFTIFYMGINIGAFLAPLACGTVGELEGWKYGFMLAGAGMVTGLLIFLYTVSTGVLEHHADPPANADGRPVSVAAMVPVVLGTVAAVPLVSFLISPNDRIDAALREAAASLLALVAPGRAFDLSQLAMMDVLLGVVGVLAVAYMLYLSFTYPVAERQRVWVIVVLLFFTTVFWTFFELAGSALNLFTDENVDKRLLGFTLTASNFQAANALFIMIFAPVFSVMWVWLARRNLDPPAPVKFAIGLLLLGAGFLVLNVAPSTAGIVPALFLILLYLLHTLGELALSPVGLSLVTKLAPAKVVGFMMGFWFLSSAIAHQAGKWIAGEVDPPKDATAEVTLALSLEVFNKVGLFAVGSGVLLLVLSPLIKKWMHGVK